MSEIDGAEGAKRETRSLPGECFLFRPGLLLPAEKARKPANTQVRSVGVSDQLVLALGVSSEFVEAPRLAGAPPRPPIALYGFTPFSRLVSHEQPH